MTLAEKYLPRYTYDDWLHWEGRWELIEGHPIAMSPMPVPEHQRISTNIIIELANTLRRKKCTHCRVYQPIDYKISDDTILQPDILIVCKPIETSYLNFPPALVVEVLSNSTALRDRNVKYDLYEKQGVRFYLIVDIKKKSIEVFELAGGSYKLREPNEYSFSLDEGCEITPELNNIWED